MIATVAVFNPVFRRRICRLIKMALHKQAMMRSLSWTLAMDRTVDHWVAELEMYVSTTKIYNTDKSLRSASVRSVVKQQLRLINAVSIPSFLSTLSTV